MTEHALRASGSSALRFDGCVVLVTGAGRGAGRCHALLLAAYTRMSASHSDTLADYLSMPKEVMDQINASMPPEMCTPAAAFLAHGSCPLNREILQIGMGGVSRIAVVHTPGISKSPLTAEDIAENLDAIMDASQARVTDTIGIEH
jgi:hypothetical protein